MTYRMGCEWDVMFCDSLGYPCYVHIAIVVRQLAQTCARDLRFLQITHIVSVIAFVLPASLHARLHASI